MGGTVADRWSRKRIVIATQTASMLLALVLAALTLGRWVRVWQIIVLAVLLGIVNSFDIPARQSFITDMVGKSRSDERHRHEFGHVQRIAHYRSCRGRDSGGGNWRGLVLLCQCA